MSGEDQSLAVAEPLDPEPRSLHLVGQDIRRKFKREDEGLKRIDASNRTKAVEASSLYFDRAPPWTAPRRTLAPDRFAEANSDPSLAARWTG